MRARFRGSLPRALPLSPALPHWGGLSAGLWAPGRAGHVGGAVDALQHSDTKVLHGAGHLGRRAAWLPAALWVCLLQVQHEGAYALTVHRMCSGRADCEAGHALERGVWGELGGWVCRTRVLRGAWCRRGHDLCRTAGVEGAVFGVGDAVLVVRCW